MPTFTTTGVPEGWRKFVSPNDIDHLIDPKGRCVTCGKTHPDTKYEMKGEEGFYKPEDK